MSTSGSARGIQSNLFGYGLKAIKPLGGFESSDTGLSPSLNTYFFGAVPVIQTLRMRIQDQWVEPTVFQKLLNPNSAHWAISSPATLSEAVNRLAAAVFASSGDTPIP